MATIIMMQTERMPARKPIKYSFIKLMENWGVIFYHLSGSMKSGLKYNPRLVAIQKEARLLIRMTTVVPDACPLSSLSIKVRGSVPGDWLKSIRRWRVICTAFDK